MIAQRHIFGNVAIVQLSFRQKAQLFHELAQLDKSAIPLAKALGILGKERWGALGKPCRKAGKALENGSSPREAFEKAGFSAQDAILVEAGTMAGRCADIFIDLSAHYTALAAAKRRIIVSSLYPVFVLHLGAILLSIPPAILGKGWPTFWENALPLLIGFYVAVIALWVIVDIARFFLAHSVIGGSILFATPFVRSFLTAWIGSTFCSVFALLLRAGTGVLRGMNTAAEACNAKIYRHQTKKAEKLLKTGEPFADASRKITALPDIALRAIAVGDHSGRLDEELLRAGNLLRESALAWLDGLAKTLPKILYFVIVGLMMYKIFTTITMVAGAVGNAVDLP